MRTRVLRFPPSKGLPGSMLEGASLSNLARDAARDGGSVPHELLELRAVCFADDGTIRRIKWIQY